MAQLSERDRNLLTNKVIDLEKQNQQLQDSITSDTVEINELRLFDIPYKKQLDELHYDIYAYEEELRLLTGKTIIKPVEEDAFWVTSPESDTYISINDGRLSARKNSITLVDIPIIPVRGYVLSKTIGTNFEIWTRDRRGSTTSDINVPTVFEIFQGNNKFKVKIDNVTKEIQIVETETLDAMNGVMQFAPEALASQIGASLNTVNEGGFTDAKVIYNFNRRTFTIVSGTVGPNSNAEVIIESTNDIAYVMKFSNQTKVNGRYANNKLKVEIDGVATEIEVQIDVRYATISSNTALGQALDDFSCDWRTEFTVGPMFPALPNNGIQISSLIENKIREVGTGGYKKAKVYYYSSSNKFIIYSGTFGVTSSIRILPHSDTLRDLRSTIGMDEPSEIRGNEQYYDTLSSLYNYLNNSTSLQCSNLVNPTKSCYSLLYLIPNIPISVQNLILQTTTEYDSAHLGNPRIYPNGKLIIDSSNYVIDLDEGNGEISKVIPYGEYTESTLAEMLQYILGLGSIITYTVTYMSTPKVFYITASNNVKFLFHTGRHKAINIGTYIGFSNTSDTVVGTAFVSNTITFQNSDYFNMVRISQLIDSTPYYVDYWNGEKNLLPIENSLLNAEISPVLDDLKAQTAFNTEAILNHWQMIRDLEYNIVNLEYLAISQEIGFYSRISMSDSYYTNLLTALASVNANRISLSQYLNHAQILNLRPDSSSFVFNTDFTEGGTEILSVSVPVVNDDKIYNLPAPVCKYADNKYLPMKYSSLFNANANFSLAGQIAFQIKSNRAFTHGIAVSGADIDSFFSITNSADSAAQMTSVNSGPFDLSVGNEIEVIVDGTALQTKIINAASAYIESVSDLADDVFVITSSNNKLDYIDSNGPQIATIPVGVYTGTALASAIQAELSSSIAEFTVTRSTHQFIISSGESASLLFATGPNVDESIGKIIGCLTDSPAPVTSIARNIFVQQNINDTFRITVNGVLSNTLTVPEGNYTTTTIASTLETLINNDPLLVSNQVIVVDNSDKIDISTVKRGYSATISVTTGVSDFLRTIYLNAAIPVDGTGDVSDIQYVSASDIASVISSNITGLTATATGNQVRVTTSSVYGTLSTIDFTVNGFSTIVGLTSASGVNQNNKLNVELDGVQGVIQLTTSASLIPASTVAADIQNKLQAIGSGGFVDSTCRFNDVNYPNALIISSGTTGLTSTAFVLEDTMVIDASNNKLDFEEVIGVQLTATITNNTYNGSSLATEIQTQLNATGTNTYTVTYNAINEKMTIESTGLLNLLFGSGTNIANTIATKIGFYRTDRSGSLSYTSDKTVKLQSCFDELNYGAQHNETGHNITDTRITITDSEILSRVYWVDGGGGSAIDFEYFFNDYSNIESLIDVINAQQMEYDIGYMSMLMSRQPQPFFPVVNGDELKITLDGTEETYMFSATAGSSTSNTSPDLLLVDGDTLTLSINGEIAQTITLPELINGDNIAAMIQAKVRTLTTLNAINQPAYTNFQCWYDGIYHLMSGTQGTGSSVSVTGGTAATKLKLGTNETAGTGDCVNNYFFTIAELISASSFTLSLVNDSGFLKILPASANMTNLLEIESTAFATKLGFYDDNLISDPVTELAQVKCTALMHISGQSINTAYNTLLGYEDRGNINIGYYVIDDSLIDSRKNIASTRQSYISTRASQVAARVPQILSVLTPTLYDSRWAEIEKRINKKNGPYYKIGEKENNIIRTQNTIVENTNQINEINSMLSM